jgi:hypothetical protein
MRLFSPFRKRPLRQPNSLKRRPRLESLDDRITPSVSSITANFNGAAMPAGTTLWFNSSFKVSGLGPQGATLHVNHASVTSSAFGVAVPDAVISLSPTATTASTVFDANSNSWQTTLPVGSGAGLIGGLLSGLLGGNTFLDGAAVTLSSGLAGGLRNVTFSMDITSDTPGVSVSWQWGCAAYQTFAADFNALGVKPVDASSGNAYHNLDRAGSPEAFRSAVISGATGSGGLNYTGNYSSTSRVTASQYVAPSNGTASLSGTVFQDIDYDGVQQSYESGIEGVRLDLTGTDDLGHSVSFTVYTDADGHYSFTALRAGTYRLTETQPANYLNGPDSVGSVNGETRGQQNGQDVIDQIVLGDGDRAVNYNFAEVWDSNN